MLLSAADLLFHPVPVLARDAP